MIDQRKLQAALKARLLQSIKEEQKEGPSLHVDVPRTMMSLQSILNKARVDTASLDDELSTTYNAVGAIVSTLEDVIHINGYYHKKIQGEDGNLVDGLESRQKYPVPDQPAVQTINAVISSLYALRKTLAAAKDQLQTVPNYIKPQS